MQLRNAFLIAVQTAVLVSKANADLLAPKYTRLPYGTVKPYGWAMNMAKVQANGLGGHLQDWYSYVHDSIWNGGSLEYSEMQEAAPYWFNGMIALAFQSGDSRLQADVKKFLDKVIASRKSDGWFGPETFNSALPRVLWPRWLALLGLIQYAEADPTQFKAITDLFHAFWPLVQKMYDNNQLGNGAGNESYAYTQARWEEFVLALEWLYDHDPRGQQTALIKLMTAVRKAGYNWKGNFYVDDGKKFPRTASTGTGDSMWNHGVNVGESLKSEALAYRFTNDQSDVQSTYDRLTMIWKYHGRPNGMYSADEHLAGLEPSRATELCSSVEAMYSLETIYTILGDPKHADMVEKIAYNALPAQNTPDFWGHQYLQQVNQIWSKDHGSSFPWKFPDNSYSNVYGMEPNYPCCTTNHPQGFPKFWAHSVVLGNSNTEVNHVLLGPIQVSTTLPNGNAVQVTVDTDYPFQQTLSYTVTATQAFKFNVRIPAWAQTGKSTVSINSGSTQTVTADSTTGFYGVSCAAGTTKFTITLDAPITTQTGVGNSISVHRGVLMYGIDLAYQDQVHQALRSGSPLGFINGLPNVPSADKTQYDSHTSDHWFLPTGKWNYAIDTSTLSLKTNSSNSPLPYLVWGTAAQPTSMTAAACEINWGTTSNAANTPPTSPATCTSGQTTVVLRPYGGTRLRIGQIPTFKSSGSSTSGSSTSTSTSTSTTSSPSSGSCSALYAQCGGQGWSGTTCCSSGTCKYSNDWYSQCL